jgi:hypothetical protein
MESRDDENTHEGIDGIDGGGYWLSWGSSLAMQARGTLSHQLTSLLVLVWKGS